MEFAQENMRTSVGRGQFAEMHPVAFAGQELQIGVRDAFLEHLRGTLVAGDVGDCRGILFFSLA